MSKVWTVSFGHAVVPALAQGIVGEGSVMLNLFLDDDGLWVRVVNSFVMNCLLGALLQHLLSKAESKILGLTSDHRVVVPSVLSVLLFSCLNVVVCSFVHHRVGFRFWCSTSSWVEDLLCVNVLATGQTHSAATAFCGLRPVVVSVHRAAERLHLLGPVNLFKGVVELVSEASQVLSSQAVISVRGRELGLTKSPAFGHWHFVIEHAWVLQDDTRLHLGQLSKTLSDLGCTRVSRLLVGEAVSSDTHVGIRDGAGNNLFTSGSNSLDRIRPDAVES